MKKLLIPLLLAPALLMSCAGKEEKTDDGGQKPEEITYSNEFPVRCAIEPRSRAEASVSDDGTMSFTWQKGDMLSLQDETSGRKEGYAELLSGSGTANGLFLVHTNLPEGSRVRLHMGSDDGSTPSRQLCSAGDSFPSGLVFSTSPFALSTNMTEAGMSSSSAILNIKLEGLQADSLQVEGITAVLEDGTSTAKIAVDAADFEGKTLTFTVFPSGRKIAASGRKLEAGKTYALSLPAQSVIPADKTKPQFTYGSVDYKTSSETSSYSKFTSNLAVDGMNWMPRLCTYTHDKWGGYDGVKPDEIVSTNTAGFWRTGKYKGRWVMVDPDGNVAILHGVNGVAPDPEKEATTGRTQELYKNYFGSTAEWARYAGKILGDYGFNFYSANPKRIRLTRNYYSAADQEILHSAAEGKRISEVACCYLLRTFHWDYYSLYNISPNTGEASVFTLMFDPKYLEFIDRLAADSAELYKDDRDFIGYYTDNELGFRFASSSTPAIYLKQWLALPTGDGKPVAYTYARAYAENFMREKYKVEPIAANVTSAMDEAFFTDICEYYYRTATEALRRHDPDHLILGSRLHGKPKASQQVNAACAKYCDIVSVNVYGVWEPNDSYFLTQYKAWINTDKPCFVTEFYTRDAECRFEDEPYGNTGEGGGWIVKGQRSRGLHYQNFTRKLLSYNHCIGWQWFQFTDDWSETYGWNGKGLISPKYVPYTEHLELMRQLHYNIYQILDYYHNPSGMKTSLPERYDTASWD